MVSTTVVDSLRKKYEALRAELDERGRRVWAATEARALGHGGISAVSQATGLSFNTIKRGLREIDAPRPTDKAPRRVRAPGAGRPKKRDDPALLEALDKLVSPTTRGDPESPLRWTTKSTSKLAEELGLLGFDVSPDTVGRILKEQCYSLQGTKKTLEGASHPDRDAQFKKINRAAKSFQRRGQPVVSVDCKKKEKLGQLSNSGGEWQPKGEPVKVNTYDFPDKEKGKAIPYGVYDLAKNEGWVGVGVDHETSEFAVETIRRWWTSMGTHRYPEAKELLITADGGGSNGSRVRLWKLELQRFADETGLKIRVCHFPPGTSKWNKIEHRMFSEITKNWRGRPLTSREVVVDLIANTTTEGGLAIEAELDTGSYPKGIKVSDAEMATLKLKRDEFHGEWNYQIRPRPK